MVIFTLSFVESCGGDPATCLSNSLDALQDQDPPPTCRLQRRREKLGQGGHGLGHHLLDGHLLLLLSRELWRWSWPIF